MCLCERGARTAGGSGPRTKTQTKKNTDAMRANLALVLVLGAEPSRAAVALGDLAGALERTGWSARVSASQTSGDHFWSCKPVNETKVTSFCRSDAPPSHVCMDPGGIEYDRTESKFKKQESDCSSSKRKKHMCPNDPSKCRTLSRGEFCGKYDQACTHTASCLAYCYADCYPCNDQADCDTLVAFGVAAEPGAPCFSIWNHTSG